MQPTPGVRLHEGEKKLNVGYASAIMVKCMRHPFPADNFSKYSRQI
jgi:hypothetical protein